jgi:hypothetical protein
MTKPRLVIVGLLVFAMLLVTAGMAASAPMPQFPEIIALPDGFQPEGVVAGRGTTLYAGSLATGAIFQADARTGQGAILVPPQEGRVSVGLDFDQRTGYLYVAGGPTGSAYVYDTSTGATVAVFQFTAEPSFVNDVIVTGQAAYFTDSFRGVLYRVPLSPSGRLLAADFAEMSLGGDFAPEPGVFKANGIVAAQAGAVLVVANSTLGGLYRVDTASGQVTPIDLGGAAVPSGDGLLLMGRTLYVVQNFLNQIAVVQLDPGFGSGTLVDVLTHPDFEIPTTVTGIGASLYVVNARFTTPPGPGTPYWIVRLPRH